MIHVVRVTSEDRAGNLKLPRGDETCEAGFFRADLKLLHEDESSGAGFFRGKRGAWSTGHASALAMATTNVSAGRRLPSLRTSMAKSPKPDPAIAVSSKGCDRMLSHAAFFAASVAARRR